MGDTTNSSTFEHIGLDADVSRCNGSVCLPQGLCHRWFDVVPQFVVHEATVLDRDWKRARNISHSTPLMAGQFARWERACERVCAATGVRACC